MSDHELLALAAKAAGIENLAPPGCAAIVRSDGEGYSCTWNPLGHSRDAFELAVDLKLFVDNCGAFSECAGFVGQGDDMRRIGCEELHEHHGGDAYAATRRAIVRAAAAIAEAGEGAGRG